MIRVAAMVSLCMGMLVLAGWVGSLPLLRSVLPGAVEMKANTALGLLAAGAALWMLERRRSALLQQCGLALAFFASVLGLATLGQYLFGWRLGIDELLFLDSQGKYNLIHGRMSPYTAVAFASIGLALLSLPLSGLRALAFLAAALTLIIGVISAIGYAWNASELTTDAWLPPMAVHTAVAFIFLSAGTLLAIRKRSAQQTASHSKMSLMEGKILTGFAGSFLLLVVGGGLTYQATTVFASSAQSVAHTQQVRAALGQLYGDMSDAALAQRNYLITGQSQQLDHYRQLVSKIAAQTTSIGLLVSDNAGQMSNLAPLQPLINQTVDLLDRGIALYRTQGFGAAKQLVDSGQSLQAMQLIHALIAHMETVEEALLVEREAAFARFQRYMFISTLVTMAIAGCIFTAFYYGIRREIKARHLADLALVSARDAAELARQEADAANHAKSTFLATMSHEIRTPMNGVLGMLELLSLSQLDGSQHATLRVIRQSGRSLMRIIDDILDFSKIEAQKLDIHPEVCCLREVIEDVHNMYSGNASSKGLLITCRVDAGLSPALMVDPVRLRQILHNFVSNAIKFTSSGQVTIMADLIERKSGEDRLRFSVKDTGIGISEEHQRHLFHPFAQAELSTTRRYGGTGLGLAICRRLAALMGGSIRMVSQPGHGTTMMLELSLPIADPALLALNDSKNPLNPVFARSETCRTAPSVAHAEAEGTLILLADDHPTNRSLLMRQVNMLGYAAESARNGVEALGLWQSGRFALLLTDCNMPEMNGYELAKAIRALESSKGSKAYPIIACTANALGSEARICLDAGMDDFLAKPVELKNLLAKLARWLPIPSDSVTVPDNYPAVQQASTPIDHSALAKVSAGNTAVEQEIFIEFQRANDGDAALLQQAVTDGDAAQVKRLAHLIKGACTMVGALRLAGVCERIERANRSADWKTVMQSMTEFHHEVADLNHYLSEIKRPLLL
ncbi:MAG: sensor hybrid histidine kinase [Polaromonas sp.]|nr:sensor hybrid histidine kinase [Polaromonas sp.]